jgi:hypothetical protein
MTNQRKRNWNAGLTLAQQAIARRIDAEHVRAFNDERARGAFGTPGSSWEIIDGMARLRVPTGREQALAGGYHPSGRLH